MAGKVIALIGGAGFIGTELARQLLQKGATVRIVDKRTSAAYPALCRTADVRDIAALREALQGADFAYNLAAEHKDNVRPRTLYDEVNVQGARNVCRIAAELAIPRIVFTSSVAVYGFAAPDTDESGPLVPFNDYGRTKMEAEEAYQEWLAGGMERTLTIVRPTVVFGPRNRGNVYNLLRQMASGRFAMVGSGKNVKSMAFVENVASFLAAAVTFGPGGHLFNYIDKPDLSMNELVVLVKQCLGLPARIAVRIPYPAAYLGGLAADLASKALGRELSISAIRVKKFCATTQFRSSRIAASGFAPPVSLREGLARTIAYEFLGGREHDPGPRTLFESE
jgi:nucleoside-diphosphate-sugar epimerase